MVLCGHCTRDCPETIDPKFGSVCCGVCGKVCRDNIFIDGDDVKGYLNTKQEYLYKKIIWEAMNKDHLREQAEKERYGTLKKSMDKRRRQQRSKRDTNANAAAEATTEETQTKKRLSSKINYNALDKLFDEEDPFVVPSGKRTRVESRNDSDDEDKNEAGTKNNDDDKEQENGGVEDQMVDDKYEPDTENCIGDEEEQENGDGDGEEAAVDEEEEDTEEWYSRNEEDECDYGYDDEGDDERW